MDQDQEGQAGQRGHGGDRQRHDGDDHVTQQVAHDRDQPRHKGERYQRGGVGQLQVPQRQYGQQEDGGEQGVERSDPELRGHDLAEGVAKVGQPLQQGLRQRAGHGPGVAHGGQGTNQQAHIGV